MAHAFGADAPIPEALPSILKEFARAAIKEYPPNINEWALGYFEKLLSEQREEALGAQIGISVHASEELPGGDVGSEDGESGVSQDEALSERIALLFTQADVDGNGTLSRCEFMEVFNMLADELSLSEADTMLIMAEIDEDDNGVVDWKEFLPVATDLLRTLIARQDFQERKCSRHGSAKEEAQEFLLKGLTREELQESIMEVFRSADNDGNGNLDRKEFLNCLRGSGLGFTRRELNLVMTLVDRDGNGTIDYEEFMPVCFNMLLEVVTRQIEEIPREEQALTEVIENKILGGVSHLPHEDVIRLLLESDLGLTRVQVYAIVSDCQAKDGKIIDAAEVSRITAGFCTALADVSWGRNEQGAKYRALAESHLAGLEGGASEFRARLDAALASRGFDHGQLVPSADVLVDVVREIMPNIDERQEKALMVLVQRRQNEAGEDGWSYDELRAWGFKTLQGLSRHHLLMGL
jgi:Ca2+-binding EF-hand superfamily protein